MQALEKIDRQLKEKRLARRNEVFAEPSYSAVLHASSRYMVPEVKK